MILRDDCFDIESSSITTVFMGDIREVVDAYCARFGGIMREYEYCTLYGRDGKRILWLQKIRDRLKMVSAIPGLDSCYLSDFIGATDARLYV